MYVPLRLTFLRDVSEDENDSGDVARVVADGRAAVCNGLFGSVPRDENRVICQTDNSAFAEDPGDRTLHLLAPEFLKDPEDLADLPANGFMFLPARQRFRNRIHQGDAPMDVGRENRIADAAERR